MGNQCALGVKGLKLIIVSIDDMNKFERNTWYFWLTNYISELIRKSEGGFKDKILTLFKTNTPKRTMYGREKKLSKPKTQNKIRNPLILKQKKRKLKIEYLEIFRHFLNRKKKKKKKLEKKNDNNRLIKDRIIRDIITLFGQENIKLTKQVISGIITVLNMKVMVIKIETYHQTDILTKSNLT